MKFLLFVNAPGLLTPTYETYLAAQLRRVREYPGLPLNLELRARPGIGKAHPFPRRKAARPSTPPVPPQIARNRADLARTLLFLTTEGQFFFALVSEIPIFNRSSGPDLTSP